jgi:hypothetical protein
MHFPMIHPTCPLQALVSVLEDEEFQQDMAQSRVYDAVNALRQNTSLYEQYASEVLKAFSLLKLPSQLALWFLLCVLSVVFSRIESNCIEISKLQPTVCKVKFSMLLFFV